MSGKRYIHLFTEPPKKASDWKDVKKDLEGALRRNVQKVQEATGTKEGRRKSAYLGDTGVALMEVTLSRHTSLIGESAGNQDCLSHTLLTSLADHHLASSFNDGAFPDNAIRDGAHISFLETPVGIATLILSRYSVGKEKPFSNSQWMKSRDYLQMALDVVNRDDIDCPEDDDGCEVLYGRAGLLYALLYLRSVLEKSKKYSKGMKEAPRGRKEDADKEETAMRDDLASLGGLLSDQTLGKVVRSIIKRGRNGAKGYRVELGSKKSPPLIWTWHQKRYLGGAHGVAGIVQMLLRCPAATIKDYMPEIVRTIDWLVHCQHRTGNWPTKAPGLDQVVSSDHELVQWCHGAPAMLILLSTILRMSVTPGVQTGLTEKQQEQFVASLQRGCALVYMHGLLRKGVGLCHGVAGSVYALLAASDVLDDPPTPTLASAQPASSSASSSTAVPLIRHAPYFTQATHLAHLAIHATSLMEKGDMRTPDHPWSLYEGMAGMCCAWQEILYRMQNRAKVFTCSGMPGYDDLEVEN